MSRMSPIRAMRLSMNESELRERKGETLPRKYARISCATINLNDDNRPYLFVGIVECKFRGLLDSGAQTSVMGLETYEYLLESGYKLFPCNIAISTVDGTTHMALGYMNVKYQVRGITRTIPTLVVQQSAAPLVLGMDFWNAYRIKPCFVSNTYGIEVIQESSESKDDPNLVFTSEITDEAAEITPPKCINVEQAHDLTEEQQKALDEVIEKLPFCKPEGELSQTWLRVAKIDTGNARPVRSKLRIIPPAKLARIVKEIDRLEARGIIRRVESSEWLNPMIAVPKSSGNLRICVDARKLNAVTKKNAYPLQNANRILSMIGKAKYVSTIDLTEAYFQVPLDESSQEKTAFAVPTRGTYVFRRMPMGLTNSGAELCSLIDSLFGSEFEPKAFPYLDDIVIVTETFNEHLEILDKISNKLKYAGLTISPSKSKFGYKRLKYLGHLIDERGIAMDKTRLEAIENYPQPTCVKDIQRLMGLAGWYRRFIQNFAEITAPITELEKKKVKFEWNEERENALKKLKEALTTAPVLASPRYDLPFEIQADSSKAACGAVLVQYQDGEERVIAYMSQKYSATQQKYHVTELECLAVLLAIERFRPYIEGTHFKVITDHHALLWLKNLKDPTGRLARWSLRLQAYDFTLVHRKGKFHVVPDALSRAAVNTIHSVRNFQTKDRWYLRYKRLAKEKPQEYDNYKIQNDMLYFNPSRGKEECCNSNCLWRLCIPYELRAKIMQENHDDATSCHCGRYKTIAKIRAAYFWPNMNADIAKYVRNCETCKIVKPHNQVTTPPAGKFLEAKRPWRVVATDIVGPFPLSKKQHRFLLVAIDLFSKFTIIKPVKTATAQIVTDFIKKEVVLKYACPQIIVCDNGVQYRSNLFKQYAENMKMSIWFTANYFPQANPTECVNKTIGNALKAFLLEEATHREWDSRLPEIENAINNSYHTSTQETPYMINFGQKMPQHGREYDEFIDANEEIDRSEQSFRRLHEKIQKRLNESREKNIKRYNLRTKPIEYQAGEIVYRENTILSDASNYYSKKLAPRFVKCKVIEKTGTNTYQLEDLTTGKIANFHAGKFHR